MKKIGLLGGTSCESTTEYYKILNEEVRKQLGTTASAKLIIESFNFAEIEAMQFNNQWEDLGDKFSNAAQNLIKSGADYIALCSNGMHKIAEIVQSNISVPLIHIADSIGKEIQKQGFSKVGLLGVIFTMEEDFYSKKLLENYNITTTIPDKEDRIEINRIIYEELCRGIIKDSSRQTFLEIIEKLKQKGVEGVILGCTEIPLLIKEASIPVFDTTKIHALDIVSNIL